MTCTACSVIPGDNGWSVECGDQRYGPYMSSGIAIRIATNEALALTHKELPAKISVQDTAGEVRVEYCLCTNFKRVYAF